MDTFGELDWTTYTTASLTGEDFGENLNSNLFSLELEKVFWNNQLHNSIQSQLDNSYIPINEARHSSTTSSEFSQTSLNPQSVSQSTASDDYTGYQTATELSPTTSLPASQRDFCNHVNDHANYYALGQISSNNSTISVQEYLTAKERSLLHRRKQNRAAQRTFRQRKEMERIELQGRLDAAVKTTANLKNTCDVLNVALEELRKRVKVLEGENSALRKRWWQSGSEQAEDIRDED